MSADMRRYTYIYSTHTYIYNYIYIIVYIYNYMYNIDNAYTVLGVRTWSSNSILSRAGHVDWCYLDGPRHPCVAYKFVPWEAPAWLASDVCLFGVSEAMEPKLSSNLNSSFLIRGSQWWSLRQLPPNLREPSKSFGFVWASGTYKSTSSPP